MQPIARFRSFYDTFSPAWIARLEELYVPDFELIDPFHTFRGDFPALRAYFERLLARLAHTQFITEDDVTGADGTYVRWRWEWQRKRRDPLHTLPGITHLRFAADGRITYHRDFFDAASGIYETMPGLGAILRAVRKRV